MIWSLIECITIRWKQTFQYFLVRRDLEKTSATFTQNNTKAFVEAKASRYCWLEIVLLSLGVFSYLNLFDLMWKCAIWLTWSDQNNWELILGMLRVGRVTGRVGSTNFYSGPGRVGSANFEISTGRAGSGQRFQKFPRVGSGHGS